MDKLSVDFRNKSGTICLSCEKINSRRKYLEHKSNKSTDDNLELNSIYELYDVLTELNLRPPIVKRRSAIMPLQECIESLTEKAHAILKPEDFDWLTRSLDMFTPDELYDIHTKLEMSNSLSSTKDRKKLLDAILDRFMTYDDNYIGKDE